VFFKLNVIFKRVYKKTKKLAVSNLLFSTLTTNYKTSLSLLLLQSSR